MEFEIFFRDLNEDAQKEYLRAMGLSRPEDANLNVVPLAVIEPPEPELMTLKLFSPITLDMPINEDTLDPDKFVYDYEIEPINLDGREALKYEEEIREVLKDEMMPDMEKRGLMEYYHQFDSMSDRVKYAYPTVEKYNGELWCVTECRITEPLNKIEIDQLKSYISGQFSDGFGEVLEQREKKTPNGSIYIHLWQSGDKFRIMTERELKSPMKQQNKRPKQYKHEAR